MFRKFQLLGKGVVLHPFSLRYNNQLKSVIALGSATAKTPLQAAMEAEDSSSNSVIRAFTQYCVIAIILWAYR